MRVSVITSSALIAFAASADAAAVCRRWKTGLFQGYTVQANGVGDRPATCGGLWDNLKRFGVCAPSLTDCSGENGELSWTFQASAGCNGGVR
jgi:hypothetical protein